MKGAKCYLTSFLRFSLLANLYGRSFGLSRSMSRRTSSALPTSALSSGVSSAASGIRSVSSVSLLVIVCLCIGLLFPYRAYGNPVTIVLTAWQAFERVAKAIDSNVGQSTAVSSAEDLQVIATNIAMWTGTASQAQTVAQELERISGYDIDSGNHINTVYGLTGNTSYDQEQICPDCAGGYVTTSTGLEVCDTCGGDGFYHWDTVPYTSTHECFAYLASWIRYLSATQTDWSSGDSGGDTPAPVDESMTINDYFVLNHTTPTVGKVKLNISAINYLKSLADSTRHKYFMFAYSLDGYNIGSNYKCSNKVFLYILSFDNPPQATYNAGTQYYNISYPSGTSVSYHGYWSDQSNSKNSVTGNYLNATVNHNGIYNPTPKPNFSRLHLVSDIMEFKPTEVSVPTVVPADGGVINVYEGDTSNITANIDNSSTSVENSTTIYDTENNTYTTVNNITTNNTVDVSAITQRLDSINSKVGQIGTDINSLFGAVDADLGSMVSIVSNGFSDVYNWLPRIYVKLSDILHFLESADFGTSGGGSGSVDLTGVESAISALSSDIDALLNAVTGSHGADALGLYGRLDTVLNWLDDYVPVDVSGIEQILEDWPDYPVFDDSGLLNAITGSHGSDLLGLYGRLDTVLNWLDDYVSPDLSTLNHQLGDLLDADGQTPTVHGLIYSVNGYVEDIDGLLSDVLALGTVTVNGTTYGFTDLLYNTWLDLSRLVGMSTVTAGEDTYSFADLLYNVWVDFGRLRDWLVEWWADLFARLDDIIDAIEDLPHDGANPWHTSPVVDPSDPEGGPIIGPIETDPYGYPKMPDWTVYKEPLNIPALEHAVDELMTKFPFSMLNTIIQVAMFIERPAVAPQFDIPAPNPSDWSQPYLVHVDLSDYDTVAATLRLGIVIWAIVKISNRTINMWVGDKGGD